MEHLAPFDIRFSQDSICSKFQNGGSVLKVINDIRKGLMEATDLPTISVTEIGGKNIPCDNRRLYVFRVLQCEGIVDVVPVYRTLYINPRKLTTRNQGVSVRVRQGTTLPHSQNSTNNLTVNRKSTEPSSNFLNVRPSEVSFSSTRLPGKLGEYDVNQWCDLMTTDQAFRKSAMEAFEPLPVRIVDSHYTIVCGSGFNRMLYICRVLEYCDKLSQISIKIVTRPSVTKQEHYNKLNKITSGERLLPHSKDDILARRMQKVRLS